MQKLKEKMMSGRQQKGAVLNATGHFSHLICNAKQANTYRPVTAAAAPLCLSVSVHSPLCVASPFVSILLLK